MSEEGPFLDLHLKPYASSDEVGKTLSLCPDLLEILNYMIKKINASYVQRVFIPLRKRYLRYAYLGTEQVLFVRTHAQCTW